MEKIKNLKGDLLKAQAQVRAVHNCQQCQVHLKAIKEHQLRGHKD